MISDLQFSLFVHSTNNENSTNTQYENETVHSTNTCF